MNSYAEIDREELEERVSKAYTALRSVNSPILAEKAADDLQRIDRHVKLSNEPKILHQPRRGAAAVSHTADLAQCTPPHQQGLGQTRSFLAL